MDHKQTPKLLKETFKKYGFKLISQGQPFENPDGPGDQPYVSYSFKVAQFIGDKQHTLPFTIVTGSRIDNSVELDLYHKSQLDESDPDPLLTTWWPRTIIQLLRHSTEYETLLKGYN